MNIPTTLPFFNGTRKQATRRDSSPALIFSPRTQLPPFLIQRPHVADAWIQDIYLVDCNGEEIDISDYFNTSTELIAGYDNGPGLYQNMNTLTVNDNTVDIDSAIKTTTGSGAAGFRTTTTYAAADEERFYFEIYLILNSGVAPKVYLSKSSDPTVLISNEVLLVSGVNKIILTATSADTVQLLFYNATGAQTDFEAMVSLKRTIRPTVYEFTDVDYIQYNGGALEGNSSYSTSNNMHPDYGVYTGVSESPKLWYYNGKTYGVWMKRGGAGYNVDSMIFAFDHRTGVTSDSYLCNTGVVDATDNHARPSVIVADDGHIIVARQKLTDTHPTAGHNSSVYINRSDNVEDESSWVNALAHNANYWSEVGVTGGGGEPKRLAYLHLAKTLNGNMYLWARSGASQETIRIFQSTDNGVSWDGFGTGEDTGLVVMDFPSASWAYNSQVQHKVDTKIYMTVNPWNSVDKRERVYFLWSTDGITWRNVDDSWSKNISSAGAITEAEAETNLIVAGEDSPKVYYYVSSFINDAGNPHFLVSRSDDDGVNYFLGYYYWNGAAWVNNEFTTPDYTIVGSTSIIYQKKDSGPVYLMVKTLLDGKNMFLVYSSDDFFVNMSLIRGIDPTKSLDYAVITENYKDADYIMFMFHYYVGAISSDIYIQQEMGYYSDFLPKGTYYLKLTDGTNAWYSEWFNIQDVYENLISSLVNASYSTFISSGVKIINAINLAGTDAANTGIFDVANDEVITVILFLTLNSGAVPQIRLVNSSGTTLRSSSIELAEGVNEIELTANAADTVKLQIVNFAPANFSTSDIWVQRKYSPRFVKLQFTNDKDLHGKRGDDQTILYQKGFTQECWLQTILNTPGSNRVDVGQEKDGVFIPEKITTQYKYRIIDYLNRSLFEGLIRLPQHKTITIIDEVGNKYTPDIGNVLVSAEWGTFDTGDVLIEWNDGSFVWVDNAEDIT